MNTQKACRKYDLLDGLVDEHCTQVVQLTAEVKHVCQSPRPCAHNARPDGAQFRHPPELAVGEARRCGVKVVTCRSVAERGVGVRVAQPGGTAVEQRLRSDSLWKNY